MTSDQLRNSILQEAISGRLVPQDPNDEPAAIVSTVPEDEIPFEIPASWRWIRMKDCAAIIGGYAFPSASIKGEKGVRVIRISDISEKGFVNKSVVRYNGHENLDKFKIIPQDILIAMTGGTVGKSLFVQQMGEDMLLNQRVAIIRNNGQFAPYIDIVVKSPHIKSFINDKKNSTNDNISMGDINSFLVPLPPLAEQKRIVAKLEELLPIVEQYGKAQKELDELNAALPARLRQSILQEAISGRLVPQDENDEPASALLDSVQKQREQLIKEKKVKAKDIASDPICDDEKPFELPAKWEFVRLNYVAIIARGGSPRPIKEYLTDSPDGLNWIKIGDTEKGGKYINQTRERIKPEGLKKSRMIHKGDFLLTNSMSFGRPYISNIDGCIHDGWLVISPAFGEVFDKNYLYYVLSSPYARDQFLGKVSGAVVQNLNSDKVATSIIPLPPLAEQQRIVAKIEELFEQIDKIKK